MRYRIGLSFAILLATACSVGVDGPVAVETPDIGPALNRDDGVKPPPPLGSGDVEISLDSPSSETPFEFSEGGPSASAFANRPFSGQVTGRYFSNSQFTNGWISFESNDCVIASPNAKLAYNEKTGKTQGHGTLVDLCDGGVTLDLSKIVITGGGFGGCTIYFGSYSCRSFEFSYDGVPGGSVYVGPSE